MKLLIFQYPYLMMTVFFMLGGFVGMFLAGLMRMAADHDTHLEVRTRDDDIDDDYFNDERNNPTWEDEHAFSWRAERD